MLCAAGGPVLELLAWLHSPHRQVSASPNFRPSFRLFNEWTALAGILLCFGVSFGLSAITLLMSGQAQCF
jgi:hypothetical protein